MGVATRRREQPMTKERREFYGLLVDFAQGNWEGFVAWSAHYGVSARDCEDGCRDIREQIRRAVDREG